ncbi:MAG: hypothetical protein WBA12_03500 [Catalinimonas sp.]
MLLKYILLATALLFSSTTWAADGKSNDQNAFIAYMTAMQADPDFRKAMVEQMQIQVTFIPNDQAMLKTTAVANTAAPVTTVPDDILLEITFLAFDQAMLQCPDDFSCYIPLVEQALTAYLLSLPENQGLGAFEVTVNGITFTVPSTAIPIDGGLGFLLIAGIGGAALRLRRGKRSSPAPSDL